MKRTDARRPQRGRLRRRRGLVTGPLAAAGLALGACTPTVGVQAPKEPIVIHMNIKIEHEIRVKVEKDLEQAFEQNEEIF